MKRNDITEVMIDDYISDLREIFDPEEDKMNLTFMIIQGLDESIESKDEDKIKRYRSLIRTSYENDICHSGNLNCEHCGNKMEVYYTPRCFHCEECKPTPEDGKGNYLMCVKWLENNEEEFYSDDFTTYLLEMGYVNGNDSYFTIPTNVYGDEDAVELLRIFKRHFPTNNVTYLMSW